MKGNMITGSQYQFPVAKRELF